MLVWVKADASMALIRSARAVIFFDPGLPIDKDFILKGMIADRLWNYTYSIYIMYSFICCKAKVFIQYSKNDSQ